MAVIDFFDKGWAINPDGTALRMEDETWTYTEAGELSCRIAHALIGAGVQRETKIAVLSPNCPTAWLCVLGTFRSGGAWVPLNPSNPVSDNITLLNRFDVEVLFYHPDISEDVEEIKPEFTTGTTFVALGDGTADVSLTEWTEHQPSTKPRVDYNMGAVAAVAPTGGSTGLPKGVMNTNRSLSVMITHHILAFAYEADERIVNLTAAPMTHAAGLLCLQTSARGGEIVIVPRASPDYVLDAIERYGVTDLFLPPTVIYRLLDALESRQIDASSLRYLMYSGAPMSTEKLKLGIERLGPVFMECYGQMEAPAAIAFMRPAEHFADGSLVPDARLGSCGRPYPMVTVAILNAETGEELPTGETGEICVRGDLVMKGYYKDPERTAETIVDGWLHTGDVGHLDAEGYLHLTDRRKDVIISGGFNVYPSEVEQVIWSHPAVQDCAVVSAPDDDWGEVVIAVVQLNEGERVTDKELIAMCRDRLGGVRTPKRIYFEKELPRSANGKVLKKDIRAPFWANTTRSI